EGVQRAPDRDTGEEVPRSRPEQAQPVGPPAHPCLVVADLHLLVHPGHGRDLAPAGVDVDALVAELALLDQLRVAAAADRSPALLTGAADAPGAAEAGHAGKDRDSRPRDP